jgi:hypothetical protein
MFVPYACFSENVDRTVAQQNTNIQEQLLFG